MTSQEMANWVLPSRRPGNCTDNLSSLFNLKPLMCGMTAMQPGGLVQHRDQFGRRPAGPALRMPGQGGQGARAVSAPRCRNIPAARSTRRCPRGQIDGAEWIGPYADETPRLPGSHLDYLHRRASPPRGPGSALHMVFNLEIWGNRWTAQQQTICKGRLRGPRTRKEHRAVAGRERAPRWPVCSPKACRSANSPMMCGMRFGRASAEVNAENMERSDLRRDRQQLLRVDGGNRRTGTRSATREYMRQRKPRETRG